MAKRPKVARRVVSMLRQIYRRRSRRPRRLDDHRPRATISHPRPRGHPREGSRIDAPSARRSGDRAMHRLKAALLAASLACLLINDQAAAEWPTGPKAAPPAET